MANVRSPPIAVITSGCQSAAMQGVEPGLDCEERVRSSFAKQGLMATLGARLERILPGTVEISLRPTAGISQQHGFAHAGAVSAIADTAAGYAALTLMAAGAFASGRASRRGEAVRDHFGPALPGEIANTSRCD